MQIRLTGFANPVKVTIVDNGETQMARWFSIVQQVKENGQHIGNIMRNANGTFTAYAAEVIPGCGDKLTHKRKHFVRAWLQSVHEGVAKHRNH